MATKPPAEKKVVAKTPTELQRLRLDKLLKNPNKPVNIPERPEDKLPRVFNPPEFIRNVWGSSAGAGSGDFHVYRGVRRREYARQKFLNEKSIKDEQDLEYQKKMEEHARNADERTKKKRMKRLRKKENAKKRKKDNKSTHQKQNSSDESEDEENNEEEPDLTCDQQNDVANAGTLKKLLPATSNDLFIKNKDHEDITDNTNGSRTET